MSSVSIYEKITDPIASAERLGKLFEDSGFFGCQRGQGVVIALACMIQQRNPMDIMRTFHIVKGRLTMRADAMLAELRKAGGVYKWIKDGSDASEAIIWIKHKENEGEVKFTIEQARKADLLGRDNWIKYPANMLRARAISDAMRMYAPEIIAGYYTQEEVEDSDTTIAQECEKPLLGISESVKPVESIDNTSVLKEMVGKDIHLAEEYLRKINWIKPGETMCSIKQEQAKRLVEKFDSFKEQYTVAQNDKKDN